MSNPENEPHIATGDFEFFAKAIVGIVLFVTLFLGLHVQQGKNLEAFDMESLGFLGNYLTGLGTLGLLVIAFYKLPKEFAALRDQRVHQERLERDRLYLVEQSRVASETIEAVLLFVDAMIEFSSPFEFSGEVEKYDKDDKPKGRFQRMVMYRFESFKEPLDRFIKARIKARIYFGFDDTVFDKINLLWSEWTTLHQAIRFLTGVGDDLPSSEPTRRKKEDIFWGEEKFKRDERIRALREELTDELKQYVALKANIDSLR